MSEPSMAEVMLALGAVPRHPAIVRSRCGRPTVSGRPCRNERATADGREWPSCWRHATAEENDEYLEAYYSAERRAREEADRALRAVHQAMPVACWSWPVTDEHRQAAADAHACPDPVQAYRLAWDLLADWQAVRCAICGSQDNRYLDHSHKTGLVRGWLCRGCNVSEGFDDIPGGQLDRYRLKNPASILGIGLRYYSPFTGWAEPEPDREAELDRSPGYLLATYLADGQDA